EERTSSAVEEKTEKGGTGRLADGGREAEPRAPRACHRPRPRDCRRALGPPDAPAAPCLARPTRRRHLALPARRARMRRFSLLQPPHTEPADRSHDAAPGDGVALPLRRLLAFTEDRTLWLERLRDGRAIVRKVFERGSISDAESEAWLGSRLRGPGFVEYLGAEVDPRSGRPSTLTAHVPAPDLTRLVAGSGPLAPDAV